MLSRYILEIAALSLFITICSGCIFDMAFAEEQDVGKVKGIGSSSDGILAEWLKSIPSNWVVCGRSSECAVIAFSCSGRFAVNRQYKEPAEKIIYSHESAAWAACNVSVSERMASTCQKSRCIVDLKK